MNISHIVFMRANLQKREIISDPDKLKNGHQGIES